MLELKTREELELFRLVLPLGANVISPQRGSAYSNPQTLELVARLLKGVDEELKKLDAKEKKPEGKKK